MSTVSIVCYCSKCDYFLKTAVQTDAVGTHRCMTCDGLMEVYIAQGVKEVVQWHGSDAAAAAALRRICDPILAARRLHEAPMFDGEFFRGGFPPEERAALRTAVGEAEWAALTSMRLERGRTGVLVADERAGG